MSTFICVSVSVSVCVGRWVWQCQPSMFHLLSHIVGEDTIWVFTPGLLRHSVASCGLLVLPQEDWLALSHST